MARCLATWSLLAVASTVTVAQTTISDDRTTATGTTISVSEVATPSGAYQSYSSQITLDTTDLGSITTGDGTSSTFTDNATQSTGQSTVKTSATDTVTFLTGAAGTSTTRIGNFSTSAATSAAPTVTNTQPCNNYPEFCARKYSNITEISCHNSPFVQTNNLAANQQYDVTLQLDDGVRFLQAQIQWPTNATSGDAPHFCHTSCDILDAGPITDWLTSVKDWVAAHPYDVVTILLGNGNYSIPSMYVPFIEQTGILRYIYTPPVVPMTLGDWPTLTEMILGGKRVVMFMDYMANQTEYPWLQDEFGSMWETPFDPTNQTFPCDVARPPNLSHNDTMNRMSLINHNLNLPLNILGASMLVPARTELNVTNNVTGYGSLGLAADTCVGEWAKAPNFLNVDYYNDGGFPGSVFEVAAKMNNVTYNRKCCGVSTSGAARHVLGGSGVAYAMGILALSWALL
ncbi:Uu.00g100990.m01.CDS01 [Anthostomella pinea]|uniref:Uu.00g100990.m01.CDS01 n=1 Tax=Anthostomella pinea TaxID=933095 RepID=A0AAI8VCZ1_9PEZI|nr:Uu.00g100990.m01.CDS01 [Anthostomella pinea]